MPQVWQQVRSFWMFKTQASLAETKDTVTKSETQNDLMPWLIIGLKMPEFYGHIQ